MLEDVPKLSTSHSEGEKLEFQFTSRYKNLLEILTDHELAALGDSCVNFIFSLALSMRLNKPAGSKVKSRILAIALKRASLRERLPSRVNRHRQADAAEALIIYAWLVGIVTIEECVTILGKEAQPEDGFSILLRTIFERVKF